MLSPYDGISIGVISALKGVGYGSADKPLPIITGQDADLASVKSITAGGRSAPGSVQVTTETFHSPIFLVLAREA